MKRSSARWFLRQSLEVCKFGVLTWAVLLAVSTHTAGAAGVVGTPGICTEAALNAALGCGAPIGSPPVSDCAGGGTVTFNCGGAVTINVTSTKTISADTTIDGGSLITISGGNNVRVFVVNSGVKFTVQNLTIADGWGGGDGGGIFNAGTLTVTNSTFSDNSVGGGTGGGISNAGTLTVTNSTFSGNSAFDSPGGGIFNAGTLTVTNSTFSDNYAGLFGGGIDGGGTVSNSTFSRNSAGWGGGISDENASLLTVTNSTFSGNSAGWGGSIAIFNAGTLTVTNSTFFGNSASRSGGGIAIGAGPSPLAVTNSTFSGNSASHGGAAIGSMNVYSSSPLTVTNSILANSTSGGDCGDSASVTDGGHNIADDGSCDLSGTSLNNTDPMLDPAGLASNGGPTQTIALQVGSPAINAGDESVCSAPPVSNLDQRGFVRPGTGATHCSIGAYEFASPGLPPSGCIGDCDGNGEVTVNEIITLVNIALVPQTQLSACPHGLPADITDPSQVDVSLIIKAVNNALNGCGG